METLLAFVIGLLFAAAFFSLLRRGIEKLAVGLILLTHATNLLIFVAAGLTRHQPPIIEPTMRAPVADPLPQALILTAIVISFGVLAFTLVLVGRTHQVVGTEDLDRMREES